MKKAICLVVLISLGALAGISQNNALIIYGKDFSFNVTEPPGWHCYTEDAYRFKLNAYFLLGKATVRDFLAIMHIRIMGKIGATIQQCLASDMKDYSKHFKKIEFSEFPVGKLPYEYVSKTYLMDDKTADYLCYIDPDKKSPVFLVFVLHGPKEESQKYEKDFVSLIKSFFWLTGNVKGIKKVGS